MFLVVGVAQAAPQTLHAHWGGTATTATCPQSVNPPDECSLTTGLADAGPRDTVELETPNRGGGLAYVGNWSIATTGTSSGAPVTIAAPTGSDATLSGKPSDSSSDSCSTASCSGTVLTVGDMHLDLHNVIIEHGDDTSSDEGPGGLSNDQGGTSQSLTVPSPTTAAASSVSRSKTPMTEPPRGSVPGTARGR